MRAPLFLVLTTLGLTALACNSTTAPVVGAPLQVPTSLSSISMNGSIDLFWNDNAYSASPNRFAVYRVFSASYDLDHGVCGTSWSLEGTTVAPEFLVSSIANGVPRCYGVTSVATDGAESARSLAHQDTPRPDAHNVLVYAYPVDSQHSGFRFWNDLNNNGQGDAGEMGLVQSGNLNSIDFVVDRHGADSALWIIPVYSGTSMRQYGTGPLADLTSIDFAPATGYSGDSALVQPGYGYVFEIVDGSVLHYGAVRVSHVGRQYLILDWSLQTDPGNPELAPRKSVAAAH